MPEQLMSPKLSLSLLVLFFLLVSVGCPQSNPGDSVVESDSESADRNAIGGVGNSRPANILLVTIDTLRADYLGCYGHSGVSTPAIDQLAAEGARFTFCVAHNVTTLPSHANIMTGADARTHGVHDNSGFRLPPESLTLAEVLKDAGYDTAAFIGAFVLDNRFGLDQGFDLYDDYFERSEEHRFAIAERLAEDVVQPALGWLDEREDSSWFAWIHLYDPHLPRYVPPPLDNEYKDNPYAGEVSYVDYALKPLFERLRSNGAIDRTLIVITGDHGEGLGDHGELSHGVFAYNTTLRVPLIIRAPWSVEPAMVVKRRVRHIDLAPTILDFIGVSIPESMEGESLLGLLAGNEPTPAPDSYFEALGASMHRGWAPLRGVLHEKWKYIDLPIPELYDMNSDFQETQSLIRKNAGTARRLQAILKGMRDETGTELSARHRLDAKARERLQSLGYMTGSPQPEKTQYGPEDDPKRLIELDAMLEEAVAAAVNEDWQRARELLDKVVSRRPQMAITYQVLAPVLVQLGETEESTRLLERAIENGINDDLLMFQLAMNLLREGQDDRAIEILEVLYERDPKDLDVAHLLAFHFSKNDQNEKAERIFQGIVQVDPTFAEARNNFGWLLFGQGRFPEALEQFDAAVEHQPEHAMALHGRAMIYEHYERWQESIENNRLALEVNPMLLDARLRLGMVLIRVRRADEAREHLNRFLTEAPKDVFKKEREMVKRVLADLRNRGL